VTGVCRPSRPETLVAARIPPSRKQIASRADVAVVVHDGKASCSRQVIAARACGGSRARQEARLVVTTRAGRCGRPG